MKSNPSQAAHKCARRLAFKLGWVPLIALAVCLSPLRGSAHQVVINEIMYDSFTHGTNEEWIELYNSGTNSVNVAGWKFTKGVTYDFAPTNFPAGGYLIIAANVAWFNTAYPGREYVMGGWTGTLANNGEAIRIEDAEGNKVDEVDYSTEGDWARRIRVQSGTHFGWDWFAAHSGTVSNKTLELINPNIHANSGQNWAASIVDGGTPGAVNSVFTNNSPALILETAHLPLVPRSTNSVIITSRIIDPIGSNIAARLFYRVDANPQTSPFIPVPMLDDGANGDGLAGDSIYGTVLLPRANGTIIEYYVEAVTSTGVTNTWPRPANTGGGVLAQAANALYQVDDSTYGGDQPLYRVIMTEADRVTLNQIVSSDRNSDAAMNSTFITIDGTGSELRYLNGTRIRGAGSRGANPPNLRVNIPADNPWKGVNAINLNTQFTHAQLAGYALAARSGLDAEAARVVQVRVNGVNLASAGSPQFGSYIATEVPDNDFVDSHFPLNNDGNIYRGSSGGHAANLNYLGTNVNSYLAAGYSKENNRSENDWSDLINLTFTLSPGTPNAVYANAVRQIVNVENWALYFALYTLTLSGETSLGTGFGDDFGMYRGGTDPRFVLLPHDWDTILGQGSGANFSTGITPFRATAIVAINRFLKHPEFVPIYYATLKRLLDTTFSDEQESRTLDEVLGSWVPASTITAMKIAATNRNLYVRSQIPLELTASSPLFPVSGFPQSATATAQLFGFSDVINTRTVLVNGSTSVWSAWEGRWTNNAVALRPGINRVLVQALGANGMEFARTNIDIWYNVAGTNVSGVIASSGTWNAANGPFNVTGNIVVPAGVTLTIEPGATIFMGAGTTFTVNGRLLAQGTDLAHIRFTRVPGGGNWGSLDFINTTNESRLEYADIDSCAGTTIGGHAAEMHVNGGSIVFFDHLVFANTPAQEYISFDASSFVVQNSVFPTYPWAPSAPEMLHGVNGIPANGYGIFRGNYFGHTFGFNDTIDFTGGQRPGPILQIINNVFDGAGDDHLDLDSADAWIEGNIFMHVHRDPNRTDNPLDTASAISGGIDFAGQFPEWTIINNLFYDVDHAFLNKGGSSPGAGRVIFVNNTLVHVAKENGSGLTNDIAAFDFTDDSVPLPAPSYGAGTYIAGNIIWDTPALVVNYNPSNHTVIFENNILALPWSGPGTNNIVADPRLNLGLIANITNADWKTVKAALTPRSGSPAFGAGLGGYDAGGMNPPGLLLTGAPVGVTTNRSATLTVSPGGAFYWGSVVPPYLWGYTHFKWKLDNGPWSAEISITNSATFTVSNLANGAHGVSVVGKNDAGYYQDDPFLYPTNSMLPAHATSRFWFVVTNPPGRVVLNEILARNVHAFEQAGKTPDVIELFNPGTTTVDLGGKGITDDPTKHYKFIFPTNATLAPGQFLLVFADNENNGSELHLGFGLNQSGDVIYLYESMANGGALIDSIKFGLQLEDLSIGRLADGSWSLNYPTIGAPNIAYPVGDISLLKINEWLTDATVGNDFIEIYNRDTLPVNIGNAYLSDTPSSAPLLHQVPQLSFLAANSYFPFVADGDVEQGADHVSFQLSPDGGSVLLSSSNGAAIDLILYGPQSTDVSEGRTPNGEEARSFFTLPTPGGPNPSVVTNVVITNITTTLVNFANSFRYDVSRTDWGTLWRTPEFDDSGWGEGLGALYYVNGGGSLPVPVNTILPIVGTPLPTTVYFRTHFNWDGNPEGTNLYLTHVIDDGAVLYLNGQEAFRYNMAPAPANITYFTFATGSVNGDAAIQGPVPIPATNLVLGDNVLAVEVHQQNSGSSDVSLGLMVENTIRITNFIATRLVLNEVMASNKSFTNADGTITDWIEIYNPGAVAADLSDLSLSDDFTLPRRWVFPAGVSIPARGYLTVKFDPGSPASTNAGPNLNTGFGFNSGGDTALLFDRVSRGGALLDSVQFGLQAADFTIGRVPNGSGAWTLTLPTEGGLNLAAALGNVGGLRVNEWMADPASGDDDYFELFNPNPQPVALGGLYLTDDLNARTKYRIPSLSFIGIGVHAFTEFKADDNPQNGADHTNFKLSAGGDSIAVFGTDGLTLIDKYTFGAQQNRVSEGRFPDGATNIVRFPNSPTPGQANFLPFNDVLINEALTHSDPPLEDAIELFNPTASPINIGGWYLSDSQLEPRKFRIPDNTIIQPGGFVVFYEYQFNPTLVFPSFSLSSANGDQIFLSLTDTNGNLTGYRSSVDFGPQVNGVTFGRFQTSIGSDFVAMTARTLGADSPATVQEFRTGQGRTNAAPKIGPVVINEIHYHPPELGTNDNTRDEFIELYNTGGSAVSLFDVAHPTNTWHLRGAVDFDFAANTSIPAGGYLLVVGFDPNTNAATLTAFRAVYGIGPGVAIVGPWDGKLANDDDEVRLNMPDEPDLNDVPYVLAERIHYLDSAPWPAAADGNTNGTGISLQRVVPLNFGNDPVNWIAGTPTPGAVNGAAATPPPIITLQPTNRTVTAGSPVTFVASASGSPGLQYQWRFNGVDIPNATNASYTVFGAQFAQAGGYSVRVVNVAGAALSATAVLSIESAPQIVFQPQDRNVALGGTATFSVGVRGTAPLEFRWFKDGTLLPAAIQPNLVLNNVQAPNLGNYFAIVSNAFGSITSAVASLQISTPPQITSQPTNQTVIVGQNVALTAGVTGSSPLFLQWYFNGLPLAGANSASLAFANVQPARAGTYSLFASNAVGTLFSSNATLVVIVPPTVTIVATDASAAEAGLAPGAFRITRANGSSNVALTVNYSIEGTAQNGVDYQSIPASVVLSPGTNFVVVNILPIDDALVEANETVTLRLLASLDYLVGSASNATVTIADNDNLQPTVAITAPTNNTFVPVTPTNILLAATASDPNAGQSVGVSFYFGTNKVGTVLAPPYQFTWTNPPSGSNLLVAVATDNFGLSATSAPIALSINGPPAVSITSPANGANVPGGGNLLITASATDTNGGVARVDFYLNGAFVGTSTNVPYSATVVNPPQAAYQAFAIARDSFGLSSTSAVVQFFVVPPSTNFADMFANRGFLSGYTNYKTANNLAATKESGEPNHYSPNAGGKSVWLSWVAPGSGVVTIDLNGSGFDTVIGVYTNAPGVAPAVNNLIKVAENDDNGASLQSKVTFTNNIPGAVFHIAIDGYNGDSGNIIMRLSLPNSPPVITTQPISQTRELGSNVIFTVAASSPTALSYQWRFNGNNIGGANNASFAINGIQQSDAGNYDVRVSNVSGSVTSAVAVLTVGGDLVPLAVFARMTNNVFTMTFTGGVTNRGYIVESSTTLTNWNYFGTIVTTGAVTVVDTNPPPAPGTLRAFRSRLGP